MTYAELKPETRAVLEAIRDDAEPMPARNLRQPEFRRLMAELAKPYLNSAGMLLVPYQQHLAFCMSISGVLRKYSGNVLFYELVAALIRWIDYGLSEATLAGVLWASYQGLKQWQPTTPEMAQARLSS